MKKVLVSAIIASSLLIGTVSANTQIQDEAGLYKAVILSRAQIQKDFGARYNTTINNFFEKMRANPDFKRLDELQVRLDKAMEVYKEKTYDKNYNLIANLYYRLKLLKDFQLKVKNTSTNTNNTTTSNNTNTNNNKNDNIIRGVNQTVTTNTNTTSSSSNTTTNNSISNIISNNSQVNSNTTTTNSQSKSLSFSYNIPSGWKEYKKGDETLLIDETYSSFQNSISFIITDYTKYNSFENFRDEYRKELERSYFVSDATGKNLDGKSTYALKYFYNNEERIVYLSEYNGMILVTNAIRRNSTISNDDPMMKVLDSIRITK